MLTGAGEEGDRIRFENVSLCLEEQPRCQQERTFPPAYSVRPYILYCFQSILPRSNSGT